jgi:hypothetical protein
MMSDDSMPEMAWCARLRKERERRQISLSSISASTKISASLFQSLERGDVSRWPSGIFRRAFIRAYASAIGLDPDEVVNEFVVHFPDPHEPSPSAGAAVSAPASTRPIDSNGLRLKFADTPTPFMSGQLLGGMRQRWAAVACDAGVLAAIAICVFIVSEKFWLPFSISMIGYYIGGILLLGNTPGVCLLAPGLARKAHYNQQPDDVSEADEDDQAHSDWRIRVPAR